MSEPDRGQESKGVKRAKGLGEPEGIKRTRLPVSPFIRSLISYSHLHSLYFSRSFPDQPTPLHCRSRLW